MCTAHTKHMAVEEELVDNIAIWSLYLAIFLTFLFFKNSN